MIVNPAFAEKSFHVFGLARTGLSTAEALLKAGASVWVWDDREEALAARPAGAQVADPMITDLAVFDALVVSPGVPLNSHPLAQRARETGTPIIGDTELFARARSALPPHRVIGVTGTNGKSTTAALIHHLLKEANMPAALGGNIGLPILSQDPLPDGGIYVLELSSYQIDLTETLACDIALLLNLSPDHLDRYDEGMAGYAASKLRLFEMQEAGAAAIIPGDDDYSRAAAERFSHALVPVSGDLLDDQPNWPALAGPHNRANAAAAIAAVRTLGLDDETILTGLRSFPGLSHRMERVAEKGGILYVNDSKATNPESTAPALAAYDSVHWIVGGRAKGDDLDACRPHFSHVAAAYLIGESTPVFARILKGALRLVDAGTVERAVALAAANANAGDTVLLSPACASFDQFQDFEERGDTFRAAVERLAA